MTSIFRTLRCRDCWSVLLVLRHLYTITSSATLPYACISSLILTDTWFRTDWAEYDLKTSPPTNFSRIICQGGSDWGCRLTNSSSMILMRSPFYGPNFSIPKFFRSFNFYIGIRVTNIDRWIGMNVDRSRIMARLYIISAVISTAIQVRLHKPVVRQSPS